MTPYPGTQVVCDARALPFRSGSLDAVFFCHAIEHFTYDDAMQILKDIKRTLKPGGTVHIEGPDVIKCVENYRSHYGLMDFIFGDMDEIRKHPEYAHKWGYTGNGLAHDMINMGYRIKEVGDGKVHGHPKRDYKVLGVKDGR